MRFYLGTHVISWLRDADVPLMVSRNRLSRRRTPLRAATEWIMDSGGFTELQRHGGWRITAKQYADEITRYGELVGPMEWAAPQDWMCEDAVIHGGTYKGVSCVGTGLSVAEHQRRTVGNYLDLMALGAPVIPVLQGQTLGDYMRCVELYGDAGINLAGLPTVGLGSVCRRERTREIGEIVATIYSLGIRCHGFGVKEPGLRRYGGMLASADSMAWSFGGRKRGSCTHRKSRCANCRHWAMEWREKVVTAPQGNIAQMASAL
jgi:hypothetical protein